MIKKLTLRSSAYFLQHYDHSENQKYHQIQLTTIKARLCNWILHLYIRYILYRFQTTDSLDLLLYSDIILPPFMIFSYMSGIPDIEQEGIEMEYFIIYAEMIGIMSELEYQRYIKKYKPNDWQTAIDREIRPEY